MLIPPVTSPPPVVKTMTGSLEFAVALAGVQMARDKQSSAEFWAT